MRLNKTELLKNQYSNSEKLNARALIHELFSTSQTKWTDLMFEVMHIQEGEKALVLGCGSGVHWRSNQARFPEKSQFILSDYSFGMTREVAGALGEDRRFSFMVMDAENFAVRERFFDLITANHMLYHLPNAERALEQAAVTLKPEGRFVAALNGLGHMGELDVLLERFEPALKQGHRFYLPFNLENGRERIARYFGEVQLIPFPGDLWVKDAALLAEYACSLPITHAIPITRKPELIQYFQRLIEKDGGIFIRKSVGIYIAKKPRY